MSQQNTNTANAQQARTVTTVDHGKLDLKALTLYAILLAAGFVQAAVFGIISACVIQLTTSIPGLNFATELAGALVMAALIKANINVGGKNITPLVAAFLTTLVSGALFAVCGTLIMGAALPTVIVKVPLVLGTAVFNAIVVQALFFPLEKVLNK